MSSERLLQGPTGASAGWMPARRIGLGLVIVVMWVGLLRVNEPLWDRVVYRWAGLDEQSRLGSAAHFFLADTVKIVLLLVGIIFVVTVLRSFITLERTRDLLGGRREGVGNVMAAGLGVVTPFCSCSAVPAFLGFVAAGVPLGVKLSFLIASPLVNEVAVVLLYGLFGFRIAALYVASGLLIAILAGFTLGRLRPERWVESFVFATTVRGQSVPTGTALAWNERMAVGRAEVGAILRRIWPYLLVGIGLGALIHGWVPTEFFVRYAGPDNPFAPLVAVALGVPLYANAAGVLPLIEALHAKGLAMGTLLAFMMSVVALSLPEMILLRRVLRPPLLACFVGVVALAILATGYLFNLIL
ncbi:MAG: permease [Mycobacterium leprae]